MTHSKFAPLAIFAYKRTVHLAKVLASLEACPEFSESPVFIFSDGPKNEASQAAVADVRRMLRERQRTNMTIVEAPANKGLAASIIGGVTQLCNEYGRVIVIEDDLLVAPCTLTWFNRGLDRFADDEGVWQVSAHQYHSASLARHKEGVLIHMSTSWGWATWKRAWDRFDAKASGWQALRTDDVQRRRFDLGSVYPFSDLLFQQMAGRVDSWAIRWWWSVFSGGGACPFSASDPCIQYRFG